MWHHLTWSLNIPPKANFWQPHHKKITTMMGLHYWHAASDWYGSCLPSKNLFWWRYISTVRKYQLAQNWKPSSIVNCTETVPIRVVWFNCTNRNHCSCVLMSCKFNMSHKNWGLKMLFTYHVPADTTVRNLPNFDNTILRPTSYNIVIMWAPGYIQYRSLVPTNKRVICSNSSYLETNQKQQ
jgi:hypothetical protein